MTNLNQILINHEKNIKKKIIKIIVANANKKSQ